MTLDADSSGIYIKRQGRPVFRTIKSASFPIYHSHEIRNSAVLGLGESRHECLCSTSETMYGRAPYVEFKLTISPAVSSALIGQLDYYAQWSAAAYCSGNTDGANTVVSCSANNCPDVQAANTTLLYEFDK
jgi:hypothetical protein